jgi:hypothetical protein
MTKDLRYPLKQRPFPQRALVLAVPRRVGLWVRYVDFEVQVGLDLDLDLYFESGGTGRICGWTWTSCASLPRPPHHHHPFGSGLCSRALQALQALGVSPGSWCLALCRWCHSWQSIWTYPWLHVGKQHLGLIASAGHGARRACANRAAPLGSQ